MFIVVRLLIVLIFSGGSYRFGPCTLKLHIEIVSTGGHGAVGDSDSQFVNYHDCHLNLFSILILMIVPH